MGARTRPLLPGDAVDIDLPPSLRVTLAGKSREDPQEVAVEKLPAIEDVLPRTASVITRKVCLVSADMRPQCQHGILRWRSPIVWGNQHSRLGSSAGVPQRGGLKNAWTDVAQATSVRGNALWLN